MSRFICLTAAFTLLCVPLSAQCGRSASTRNTSIVLVQTRREDSRPAPPNLYVELFCGNGVPIDSGYTDHDGVVSFPSVPSGAGYYLEVTGEAIEELRSTFFIEPGKTVHKESITVSARQENTGVPLRSSISAFELNVPKEARKELAKGDEFAHKHHWLEAAQHYEKAIDMYPKYVGAYNNLGTARMHLNDPAGARSAYEHAVVIDGKYAKGWLNLASLELLQGKISNAEKDLLGVEAVEPTNLRVLTLLAETEFRLSKYDQVERLVQRIHALRHKGFAVAHAIAGSACQNQGRSEEALAEYKLYLEEAPDGQLAPQVRATIASLQKRLSSSP